MNIKRFIALLLAACLLLGLLTACAGNDHSDPGTTDANTATGENDPAGTTAPTNPTNAPLVSGEDVTARSNYAISEASPHDENMSAVIAVNADGEPVMTNSMLQFIYWLQFFNFMNYYGDYAAYFGLDVYTPLADQVSLDENRTWEQYFLEDATKDFAQQYALYRAALAAGHTLSETEQEQLDDILDPNGSIATGAAENGYASATEYMQATFGPGVDLQDYYDYVTVYITANSYYNALSEQTSAEYENADEAALSAFYDAHAAYFFESKVQKVNNVSVRHILIQPAGEQDADGNYSSEAWAAAEATANEILAQWQQNPTEDNFAALANENSADPGSNTTGGLYADFNTSTMVEEFTAWSFDPARTYGDTGIVRTSYGYHIMFFVGPTETKGWMESVSSHLMDAVIYDICADYPVAFYFSNMRIYDIVSEEAANYEAQESTEDMETVVLPEDTFEDDAP